MRKTVVIILYICVVLALAIATEVVCEYGLPYKYTTFPTYHNEMENTSMEVENTTTASMFWEELSLFNNQFISPSTSTST